MVVSHNISAENTNRQLGITSGSLSVSTERLSSGYRINRAADDAAGLSISEKMRSQVRGLDRASTNAQDGVSVVQSAEGALNEVHSILQRMNELATQAANDTNTQTDRSAIQQEIDDLLDEIDRVSSTTQFNTVNLLDGSFSGKNLQVGALSGQNIGLSISSMSASALGLRSGTRTSGSSGGTGSVSRAESTTGNNSTVTITISDSRVNVSVTDRGKLGAITAPVTLTYHVEQTDSDTHMYGADSGISTSSSVGYWEVARSNNEGTHGGGSLGGGNGPILFSSTAELQDKYGIGYSFASGFNPDGATITLTPGAATGGSETPGSSDGSSASGGSSVTANGISVMSFDLAGDAMERVQSAIDIVSEQRARLGAVQNRLEHTIANLNTTSENTSAAESRIRDTDMATEMARYSKNQILVQAGQSMLAQANQSTQGVLSILG